jgi:hypothetical protein
MDRHEMTALLGTEAEAEAALRQIRSSRSSLPPMWPITDIRVERRLVGKADDPDRYRWVVAGDYSAWPR